MIAITRHLAIPEHELTFVASRSSGPGGQHVNKVSSRITLYFNVCTSPSLTDAQKQRLLSRLATRIDKEGVLRVVAQKHRSQTANRDAAIARFVALLQEALAPVTVRRQTTVSPGVRQQRLEEKRRRGDVKQQRAHREDWDA